MQIQTDILDIHAKFESEGFELFLVGGCVRDHLLGIEPKDFDMATNAFPEEIERILSDYRMDMTGKRFGVMRVYTKEKPIGYEIATYREDVSQGRQPIVKVGSTMEVDAMRRDLTINALYYDIRNKKIIDTVDGVKDLENRIINTPGDPVARFDEDRLRILRALRFVARIDGKLNPKVAKAIYNNNKLEGPDAEGRIIPIAQEAITEEFIKGIHQASKVSLYLEFLDAFKMFPQIFRGLSVYNTEPYEGTSQTEVVLASLLRFNTNRSELFNRLVYTLKIPSKIADGVVLLLNLEDVNPNNAYDLKKRMVKTELNDTIIMDYARMRKEEGFFNKQYANMSAFCRYEIKTRGEELIEEGFNPGPALGVEIAKREKENFEKILQA